MLFISRTKESILLSILLAYYYESEWELTQTWFIIFCSLPSLCPFNKFNSQLQTVPIRFTSLVLIFIACCAWVMTWSLVRGRYSELGAWNNFFFYSPLILFLNESLLNLLGITHQYQYYISLKKKKKLIYKFNFWVTCSLPPLSFSP